MKNRVYRFISGMLAALAFQSLSAVDTAALIDVSRLGITSVFAITNGPRPPNNPYYGVLNLFDGGENRIDDINYSYWLSHIQEYNWVIVKFTQPVEVALVQIDLESSRNSAIPLPAKVTIHALVSGDQNFFQLAEQRLDDGKNFIKLPDSIKRVSELLIIFPDSHSVRVEEMAVFGNPPAGIDLARVRPTIANENRRRISDFLEPAIPVVLESPSPPPRNCASFATSMSYCENAQERCSAQMAEMLFCDRNAVLCTEDNQQKQARRDCSGERNACVFDLVDHIGQCVDKWVGTDEETGLKLLEVHRFLRDVRISVFPECPRFFYRWGGRGSCTYDDGVLERIEKQFPDSGVRYDAAWMTARRISKYYECEGFWDCIVESHLYRARWYLERYPNSPHAKPAVALALQASDLLDQLDLEEFEFSQSDSLPDELETLKSLAPRLQKDLANQLLSGLEMLESRLEERYYLGREVERMFDAITSGNPQMAPRDYLDHAEKGLIKRFLQSNIELPPEPRLEWMQALFEIAEANPQGDAAQLLCRFAATGFESTQILLVDYLTREDSRIDESRCHPDLAPRLQSLLENPAISREERSRIWQVWSELGNRHFSTDEVAWMAGLLDDSTIGYLPANTLDRVQRKAVVVAVLETITARLEAGKPAWADHILRNHAFRTEFAPYRRRIAVTIPELLVRSEPLEHRSTGARLLVFLKDQIAQLYSSEERARLKHSIAELVEDLPSSRQRLQVLTEHL